MKSHSRSENKENNMSSIDLLTKWIIEYLENTIDDNKKINERIFQNIGWHCFFCVKNCLKINVTWYNWRVADFLVIIVQLPHVIDKLYFRFYRSHHVKFKIRKCNKKAKNHLSLKWTYCPSGSGYGYRVSTVFTLYLIVKKITMPSSNRYDSTIMY